MAYQVGDFSNVDPKKVEFYFFRQACYFPVEFKGLKSFDMQKPVMLKLSRLLEWSNWHAMLKIVFPGRCFREIKKCPQP